ncbi:leucine-rich repeat domain-containing protein [Pseudoprevotella muciniphila]|uniref:leucine-rich repeat domain-containing protein n=1 Tax=Pseudoprevotella muciniphila TaxID=2133944 RepID=UPI0011BD0EC1|nr:leucine-rich repeat domain-containing protein [Pseudoprevotella muciniphila]
MKIVDAEDANYYKMELSNSNLDEFKTGCFGVLRCQNNNITELRVTGSNGLYASGNGNDKFSDGGRLFYNGEDGNSVDSLTMDGSMVVVMDCSNLGLTNATLDIKKASYLEFLNVSYNNIDSLDLSNCPSIKEVYCQDNGMTSLTTNAPTLRHLECQRNNISKLNISGSVSYNTYWKVLPSAGYEAGSDTYVYISGSRKIYQINYSSWSESEPRSVDGEVRCEKYDYFDYTARRWMHCDHRDSFEEEYYDYDAGDWYTRTIAGSTTRTEIPAPAGYTAQQVTDTIYSGSNIAYLDCSNNSPMTSLTLPGASNLKTLYCYNNNNLDALDVTACTSLQRLYMSHTKIPAIDLSNCKDLRVLYAKNRIGEPGFANWNHGLTSLDCSGLTNLQTVLLSRNKITSLDMSGCSSLRTLTCDNQGGGNDNDSRLLETLNLTGCSNLTSLDCQNNALTSLDLSTCTRLLPNRVKGYVQRAIKDVVVLDRDKICIELPNGVTPTVAYNGTISDINMDNYFGTWAASGYDKTRNKVVRREGKTYLVLYDIGDDARGGTQTKYDVDYYGRILKYQYALAGDNWDETLGGSLANSKKNDNVTVTIYPYVMYVNPLSKDVHSTEVTQQGKAPFYSGTIYLDYDAIVPAGATAYIAKKININKELIYSTAGGGHEKVTADQLELVPLVAGEGASEVVIPALTPVYIKSDTEFGLFSFDRNNHGGVEQALGYAQDGSDLIQDNIFRGVLQDSTITKYSVLSLGRGRPKGSDDNGYTTESRIGFWPSSNTKIPAHRVFIPMSELENAGIGSGSPGLLFSFMGNDEGTTTGIRPALINRNEGWYTINGIRLNGRPTEKGIYIHNGRKEVIR